MRRHFLTTILVAWLAVALSTPASAVAPRVYEGRTSQGSRLQFELGKRADGGLRLRSIRVRGLILTCELDASMQRWAVELAWAGAGMRMDGRRLDLDLVDPFSALHVEGRFGALRAGGGLHFTVPQLTEDGRAQLCTTDARSWVARRTAPSPRAAIETGSAAGDVVRHEAGNVTVTMIRSP
jgi:hypothetical protein